MPEPARDPIRLPEGGRLPSPVHDGRFRELFETTLVGIYVSTPSGALLTCNPAFARLLGFPSVDAALGTDMSALYPSSEARRAFVEEVGRQQRIDGRRAELIRRDGTTVHILETVAGHFAADGELLELRGSVIDISESMRAEQALRESERQFRSVFQYAGDAMLILDAQRGIVEANPATLSLIGVDREALIGRTLDDLLAEDPAALGELWQELLACGEAKHEHRFATPSGPRLVECTYRAHMQSDRHVCIARDATERRLLEQRLMQSEKIESIGRLAGGIAHDFNNLLTAILGYTELLLAKHPAGDADRPDLEEIHQAGRRAAGLTQQLLAFSRKQVLMPSAVDLGVVVIGLKTMLARLIRKDITLHCTVPAAPAFVLVDQVQIEQAIINLVLNARDALVATGTIAIDIARVAADEAKLPAGAVRAAREFVRLRVADDGVGMPAEVQTHLFEPFFTTKDIGKGTGLGLASVHGIVTQSNGHITVTSAPGQGTTIAIYLPAVAAPVNAATEPTPADGAAITAATILLVEDEDAVRTIVGAMLRRQGYTVLEASTPRGAIEIFERAIHHIDLLLTDVVMPGMNGPALAQRLVASNPDLRVLFISGYADFAAAPVDLGSPNIAFLSKPFQASVLKEKVQDVLRRPSQLV